MAKKGELNMLIMGAYIIADAKTYKKNIRRRTRKMH